MKKLNYKLQTKDSSVFHFFCKNLEAKREGGLLLEQSILARVYTIALNKGDHSTNSELLLTLTNASPLYVNALLPYM